MTKRELINILEAIDAPDNTEVLRSDYEYQNVILTKSSVVHNERPVRYWGKDGYATTNESVIIIE